MSCNDRTPQGRRRIALSLGTAAGASLAAAFISMGTAHAIPETPDPFGDLLGATNGGPLDTLVNTLDPSFAANLDFVYDGIVPTDVDPFADLLGPTFGAPIDTLLGPTVGAVIESFADQISTSDADPFAELFGATFGAPIDTLLGVTLSSELDPFVDLFLPAI